MKQNPEHRKTDKKKRILPIMMTAVTAAALIFTVFQAAQLLRPVKAEETVPQVTEEMSSGETAAAETAEGNETEAAVILDEQELSDLLAWCGDIPAELKNYETRFYYNQLTEYQQQIYRIILHSAFNQIEKTPEFPIPDGDASAQIFRAMKAMWYDYGEIFWFRNQGTLYTAGKPGNGVGSLELQYAHERAQRVTMQDFIDSVTQPVTDSLQGLSDYEKILGVHDFLIDYLTYDNSSRGASLYDTLSSGTGVCEGYTRAAQYMLGKLGIPAVYISGQILKDGEFEDYHAWNLVEAEGDYYQMDVTWDDAELDDGSCYTWYDYLLVTDEEMMRNRTRDLESFPACDAQSLNYFRVEEAYAVVYDPEQIIRELRDSQNHDGVLQLRAMDEQVLAELKTRLIDEKEIYDYLRKAVGDTGPVTYWVDWDTLVFRLHWG